MNPSNLVVGFNPSEKYQSKWESSPNRGENENLWKNQPENYAKFINKKNIQIAQEKPCIGNRRLVI